MSTTVDPNHIDRAKAIHAVLHGEFIPIACGGAVLLTSPKAKRLAVALASRARLDGGWPWVSAESVDDEVLGAAREAWAVSAPGWLRNSDDSSVRGMLSHSGIAHHLRREGHFVLTDDQRASVEAIRKEPEIAEASIVVYAFGPAPQATSVAQAVLSDAAFPAEGEVFIADSGEFDEWDGVGGLELGHRSTAGPRIAESIAKSGVGVLPILPR